MKGCSNQGVCVVTDSTADVLQPLVEELDVAVVPCYVHFGQETFLDGVDLGRGQFYARLAEGKVLPTTSQPAVGTFAEVYQRLAQQNKQVISIHPAAKLSAVYSAARLSAEMISNSRTALIDSTQVSMGAGRLAVLAARAAQASQTLDAIVEMIGDTIPHLRLLAVIDDLHYLQRGGRVGSVDALVGSLLQIKPSSGCRGGRQYAVAYIRPLTDFDRRSWHRHEHSRRTWRGGHRWRTGQEVSVCVGEWNVKGIA